MKIIARRVTKIKKEMHLQEQLRKKYQEIATKREEQRGKEAEARRVELATRVGPIFPHLDEERNEEKGELLSMRPVTHHEPPTRKRPSSRTYLSRTTTSNRLRTPTVVGERLHPGPPGAPRNPPARSGAAAECRHATAAYRGRSLDDADKERVGAPDIVLDAPDDTIRSSGQLDPNYNGTQEQRANELRAKPPSLNTAH